MRLNIRVYGTDQWFDKGMRSATVRKKLVADFKKAFVTTFPNLKGKDALGHGVRLNFCNATVRFPRLFVADIRLLEVPSTRRYFTILPSSPELNVLCDAMGKVWQSHVQESFDFGGISVV